MKISLYSPACLNILKSIRNSARNGSLSHINRPYGTYNVVYNTNVPLYSNRARFYSSAEGTKVSEEGETRDPEEEHTANEEEAKEDSELSPEEALRVENETMKQKLATLETKLKELELKYKMSLSNCDNLCKIHRKELENAKVYAVTEFAKGLLEVADTFELALNHLSTSDSKGSSDDFVDGIRMTESMLHQTFERFGIKKYESLNEDFNPQVHEAMFEVKGQDTHNKVIQVVKNGYTISGRILRPAKVGVSKK